MQINKLILREGMFEAIDTYENITLVHSAKNSCGKSTYFRFLFYALGYQIPSMKGVNYLQVTTEMTLIERNNEFVISRAANAISVTNNGENTKVLFCLPNEHNAFLGYIFDSDKVKVLNNLLGIMYVDQDKGWSLLNRGTVIGRIKFSIEELLSGLADIDCDDLIDKQQVLKDNEEKYKAMLNINKLSEEVYNNNGEIFISEIEKNISSKISLIDLKIRDVKDKINTINVGIKKENDFWKFIESMQLQISHDGDIISVNRDNVIYSSETTEYLKARRNLLSTDMRALMNERTKLQNKLKDYYDNNTEISKLFGDTQEVLIDRKLSMFSFDIDTVNKLLDRTQKDLKNTDKDIRSRLRTNNKFIQKVYDYVKTYAQKLQISDKIDGRKDYIFTTDLKSFSGANLQKLVFAFKLAFLKVIEEVLDCKLIMVLDSPRGKELDDDNLKLIMNIVNEDLKENQVFIASIYDDFHYDKKIELKHRAIENRNSNM